MIELAILIWAVMLLAAYVIAEWKGRDPQGALIWTLLMGPIGLLGVMFWKREEELDEEQVEEEDLPRRPAYSQRLRQRRADDRRWRPGR